MHRKHRKQKKEKRINRVLATLRRPNRRYIFVILFAILGSALLLAIRAAAPTASFEAEQGTRNGGATVAPDTAASAGNFLQFANGAVPPPMLGSNWRVVFQDEFSDAAKFSQDWETHASFTPYIPGQVTLAGGLLTLKTGASTNNHWAIVSTSGPRSNSEPNYPKMKAWREGYFEARLRFTDNEWSWPAFWLFSAAKSEAWPGENCPPGGYFNAEWDIMENGVQNGWQHRPGGDWFFTNVHRNTTDNTADGYCRTPDQENQFAKDYTGRIDLSGWHTWGGRWIGNQLCTYLDNQQLNCTTAYDTMAQPMELHLDMNILGTCPASWCGPRPTEVQMQVDWVKVWKQL